MRFSLLDLLIGIGCGTAPGACVGFFIAGLSGHKHLALVMALSLALVSYFLITPSIYRWFHLRSLVVPRCPHCHEKNRWYWYEKAKADWPHDVIMCATCKNTLELWYEVPQDAEISTTMPSFQLLWPQSWGRWRMIADKKQDHSS